jgi:uncharacterized protein with HEPN domain
MPERDWKLLLRDILLSTEKILVFTRGITRKSLFKDELTLDAVRMNL